MGTRYLVANEPTPARRRIYFDIRQPDGLAPALGEAGGQPQLSTNGTLWTDTGIGTLVAIGQGRYYAELAASAVASAGDRLLTRYRSAATAESAGDDVQVLSIDPLAAAWPADVRRVNGALVDGSIPAADRPLLFLRAIDCENPSGHAIRAVATAASPTGSDQHSGIYAKGADRSPGLHAVGGDGDTLGQTPSTAAPGIQGTGGYSGNDADGTGEQGGPGIRGVGGHRTANNATTGNAPGITGYASGGGPGVFFRGNQGGGPAARAVAFAGGSAVQLAAGSSADSAVFIHAPTGKGIVVYCAGTGSAHALELIAGGSGRSIAAYQPCGFGAISTGGVSGDWTGNLLGSVQQVAGSVGAVAAGGIAASSFTPDAVSGAAFSQDAADRVWTSANRFVGGIVAFVGTTTAASANTVTLDNAASPLPAAYLGHRLTMLSGAAAGEARTIVAYDGNTRIATIAPAWPTPPAAGDSCVILGVPPVLLADVAHVGASLEAVDQVIEPSAGHIADAVWMAAPAGFDPATLNAILARLGTGRIVTIAPLSVDGQSLTVVRGDDYHADDGRALDFTDADNAWPSLAGAVVRFTVRFADRSFRKLATVMAASGPARIRLELTQAETADFPITRGSPFDLEATLASGRAITLLLGTLRVLEDVTTP